MKIIFVILGICAIIFVSLYFATDIFKDPKSSSTLSNIPIALSKSSSSLTPINKPIALSKSSSSNTPITTTSPTPSNTPITTTSPTPSNTPITTTSPTPSNTPITTTSPTPSNTPIITCPAGFLGPNCEFSIANYCNNNATNIDYKQDQTTSLLKKIVSCYCKPGFTGTTCNKCTAGLAGPKCDKTIGNYCSENTKSIINDISMNPVCNCKPGFSGTLCDSCAYGFGPYPSCNPPTNTCPDRKAGDNCEFTIEKDCSNNATAIFTDQITRGPVCICKTGFTGDRCNICDDGYGGPLCNYTRMNRCSNKGTINPDGTCTCDLVMKTHGINVYWQSNPRQQPIQYCNMYPRLPSVAMQRPTYVIDPCTCMSTIKQTEPVPSPLELSNLTTITKPSTIPIPINAKQMNITVVGAGGKGGDGSFKYGGGSGGSGAILKKTITIGNIKQFTFSFDSNGNSIFTYDKTVFVVNKGMDGMYAGKPGMGGISTNIDIKKGTNGVPNGGNGGGINGKQGGKGGELLPTINGKDGDIGCGGGGGGLSAKGGKGGSGYMSYTFETPVTCSVSDWSSWKNCSASCRTKPGNLYRTRTIIKQPSSGNVCPTLREYKN
jgi:hypothetical protein